MAEPINASAMAFCFPFGMSLWDGSRVQVGKLYGFIVIKAADEHLHWTVHLQCTKFYILLISKRYFSKTSRPTTRSGPGRWGSQGIRTAAAGFTWGGCVCGFKIQPSTYRGGLVQRLSKYFFDLSAHGAMHAAVCLPYVCRQRNPSVLRRRSRGISS